MGELDITKATRTMILSYPCAVVAAAAESPLLLRLKLLVVNEPKLLLLLLPPLLLLLPTCCWRCYAKADVACYGIVRAEATATPPLLLIPKLLVVIVPKVLLPVALL